MEVTVASILADVGLVFAEAIEMAGTAATTIAGNPMLMVFWVLPLVGLGIGILNRLK